MPIHSLDSSPDAWGTTIKARFRIVTPMFLGDAEQQATTIRPTAIKGALRFWWRAIYWADYYINTQDTKSALHAMAEDEARLFGSVAGGYESRSAFSLSVSAEQTDKPQFDDKYNVRTGSGKHYLLGQGLSNRSAAVGGAFQLTICFYNTEAYEQHRAAIINTIIALSSFGGLGARARHGWGSVALTELMVGGVESNFPNDIPELKKWIKSLPQFSEVPVPPFSAFSGKSRFEVVAKGKSADDLLVAVGTELQMYRSHGRSGKIGQKDAEKNFQADYDLVAGFLESGHIDHLPERTVFGLPHNYYYGSRTNKGLDAKAEFAPLHDERQRRASPLFLHIHQFPNRQFMAIHTLMVAEFLPERELIRAYNAKSTKPKYQREVEFPFQGVDWEVITQYLNRYKNKESLL